jgi:hypothetical protein
VLRMSVLGVVPMLVGALLANALALTVAHPAAAGSPVPLGASALETKEHFVPPAGPGINIHQSVGATDLLTGTQGWLFGIVNSAGLPVTDPAITVDSGWSPSLFPRLLAPLEGGCPGTISRTGSAFPYTWADASLPLRLDDNCYLSTSLAGVQYLDDPPPVMGTEQDLVGQGGDQSPVAPPISFRPGYDSFRDVDTTTVAPGGTQRVTVGFTVRDPSIALVQVQLSSFMTPELITWVTYPEGVPDCTAASDPAATCLWWWNLGPRPDPASSVAPHSEWNLRNPVPGLQYTFVATFTNEGDAPVSMIPDARFTTPRTFASPALITDTSVRVKYPDLDGGRPGSGTVDFTIGAGQAATWTVLTSEVPWVIYGGGSLSYEWNGFYAPVDNGVLNTAKAGSSIPVKFSLGGDRGLNVFPAGYPRSALVKCDGSMPTDPIEAYTAGASSLAYDPGTGRYVYVWKTDKSWSNTCRQLQVMLADGSLHSALFSFR